MVRIHCKLLNFSWQFIIMILLQTDNVHLIHLFGQYNKHFDRDSKFYKICQKIKWHEYINSCAVQNITKFTGVGLPINHERFKRQNSPKWVELAIEWHNY